MVSEVDIVLIRVFVKVSSLDTTFVFFSSFMSSRRLSGDRNNEVCMHLRKQTKAKLNLHPPNRDESLDVTAGSEQCTDVYPFNPYLRVICVGRLLAQVYESGGNCGMVDTGHSRPLYNSLIQLASPQSHYLHPACTRPSRTASGFHGKRRSTVCRGTGSQPGDIGEVSDTVSYVMDVKRALASQPDVYRQFVEVLRRHHDMQRRVDSDHLDLDAIRRVVSLLRTRPHLVLGFNEFLPDGYRIRMFDRSGYVIEYPDDVGGIAMLTIAV